MLTSSSELEIKELIPIGLQIDLTTQDGNTTPFHGTALQTKEEKNSTISIQLKTDPIRRVEIKIPFLVSADCNVSAHVNGNQIAQFAASAQKGGTPLLNVLALDVTDVVARKVTSEAQLTFSFGQVSGIASILKSTADASLRPQIQRKWVTGHSLPAVLFFFFLWVSLIQISFSILATLLPATPQIKAAAGVLFIFIPALLSFLAFIDLIKLRFRDWLRKLRYGVAAHGRLHFVILVALAGVFALASAWNAIVINGLWTRYQYTRLIEKAIEDSTAESLRRAFVFAPWRKEAQILFEHQAYLKGSDGFRDFVLRFVTKSDVQEAVFGAGNHPPFSIDKSALRAYNDPLVWYATVLPQADADDEFLRKAQAVWLLQLRNSHNIQAELMRNILEIYLLGLAKKEVDVARKTDELQHYLDSQDESRVIAMAEYQVARDLIGQQALRRCYDKDPRTQAQEINAAISQALASFKKALDARKQMIAEQNEPVWIRPPGQMLLFYIFKYKRNESEPLAKRIRDSGWARCPGFENQFVNELYKPYKQFGEDGEKGWLQGTVIDPNAETYIRQNLLARGWRY